jgi:hypothetical protein
MKFDFEIVGIIFQIIVGFVVLFAIPFTLFIALWKFIIS